MTLLLIVSPFDGTNQELLGAGADTTGSTIEWMLLELVRHPQVKERLQKEIDAKFGMLRRVEDDEAAQLPYLQVMRHQFNYLQCTYLLIYTGIIHSSNCSEIVPTPLKRSRLPKLLS